MKLRIILFSLFVSIASTQAVEIPQRVLIIGVDGLSPRGVGEANTPHLDKLMARGAWSFKARAVMPTSSSPNWASMIMGAGPEQHGITSNDWRTNKFEIAPTFVGPGGFFPTIFAVLNERLPAARTACVYDWGGFGNFIEHELIGLSEHVKGSLAAAQRAGEVIRERKPHFLFLHLDDVDGVGHSLGWHTPHYFKAVEMADTLIGDVLQALADAGLLERTTVIVTSDHGGIDKKHGGSTMAELEIPWLIAGPGVKRNFELRHPINTYDTAATAARVLGVKPPAAWIGRAVEEAFDE